jgi:hypothetical protein
MGVLPSTCGQKAHKWTKADIERLKAELDGFYLINRPLEYLGSCASKEWESYFRKVLADNRLGIVLQGLQVVVKRLLDRAGQNDATSDHYLSHYRNVEIYNRFRVLATEARREAKLFTRLMERVKQYGLPQEVIDYDPLARP